LNIEDEKPRVTSKPKPDGDSCRINVTDGGVVIGTTDGYCDGGKCKNGPVPEKLQNRPYQQQTETYEQDADGSIPVKGLTITIPAAGDRHPNKCEQYETKIMGSDPNPCEVTCQVTGSFGSLQLKSEPRNIQPGSEDEDEDEYYNGNSCTLKNDDDDDAITYRVNGATVKNNNYNEMDGVCKANKCVKPEEDEPDTESPVDTTDDTSSDDNILDEVSGDDTTGGGEPAVDPPVLPTPTTDAGLTSTP